MCAGRKAYFTYIILLLFAFSDYNMYIGILQTLYTHYIIYIQTFRKRNIFLSIWNASDQLILFIRAVVRIYTYIRIPQPGDFIHSGRVPRRIYYIYIYVHNEDEDETAEEGKSNFFAPIKTLSPALFG